MTLVGITGRARSGKDTLADFLVSECAFTKYSFAKPIKEAVKVMFGLTEDHVNGHLKEVVLPDLGVSPRFLMQTLGTEWGRQCVNEDVWLLAAQRNIEQLGNRVIIADVRFENEASFIRKNGGVLIHVVRDNCEQVLAHASENGVSFVKGDVQLSNNGSLGDFYVKIAKLAKYGEIRL